MRQERKEDLSVYYYINDLFSGDSITTVDGFPESNLELPSVAVEATTVEPIKFELGNRNRVRIRTWYIYVFAQTKAQRDEIGYRILDSLEQCIPVYDYDEGFPPDTTPTNLGCLNVDYLKMEIIRVMPELVDKLYYRAVISFTAQFDQLN